MARFGWIALCVIISAILAFLVTFQASKKRDAFALSTVKVLAGEGHGSGVHTGNRFIITAAHVVGKKETVTVKATHGGESTADVLWTNKHYDIALLRARDLTGVGVSRLDCDGTLEVGQTIEAIGNPGPLEFIHTFGRVASGVEKRGPWAEAYIASMTVAGGMSGGPVIDARGYVVGIVVGIALTQIGGSASALSLSYIVPSETVCSLLMRPRNSERG
jgi:S1-C subfamily serine protease